jgi:hypothetical protein
VCDATGFSDLGIDYFDAESGSEFSSIRNRQLLCCLYISRVMLYRFFQMQSIDFGIVRRLFSVAAASFSLFESISPFLFTTNSDEWAHKLAFLNAIELILAR